MSFDADRFAAQLTDPLHRALFELWLEAKPTDGLPPRLAVADPFRLGPEMLPWVLLVDVDRSGGAPRFRFRLVGTGNVRRYGRDTTGLWFEQVYDGETYSAQMAIYGQVATSGEPAFTRGRVPIPDKSFVSYERLILPLAGDGGRCDHLIALMRFQQI